MSKDMQVGLIITGNSRQLKDELRRSEADISRFGEKTKAAFGRFGSIKTNLVRSILNPITALGSGVALVAAGKQIIDFDSKLSDMAIQARLTAAAQMALRKEIVNVAFSTGQSRTDVLGGMAAIVERIGDINLAQYLMKDLATAATATTTPMADMGALAANLYDKMGLAKEEIKQALNILTVQGKAGAFTLQNMAGLGERLFSAAASFNIRGMDQLKAFGAFIQIARKGTGSPEMATTAVERSLSTIIEKAKQIYKLTDGFDIFDREKSKNGVMVAKDFETVIKGIVKGTKGDIGKLQKIFGEQGIRAINPLALEFQRTGKFELFDEFKNADIGRQTETIDDANRKLSDTAVLLKQAGELFMSGYDTALSGSIQYLSTKLKELTSDPERLENFKNTLKDLAKVLEVVARIAAFTADKVANLIDLWSDMAYIIYPDANPYEQKRKQTTNSFNQLPLEKRKAIFERVNRGESVSIPEEIKKYRDELIAKRENSVQAAAEKPVVNIDVTLNADGRVDATSDSGDTNLNVNVPRGKLVMVPGK